MEDISLKFYGQKKLKIPYGDGLIAKFCLTLVTPWTVACEASPSMGLPRQE